MSKVQELQNKYQVKGTNQLMEKLAVTYQSGMYEVGKKSFRDFNEALIYADKKLAGLIAEEDENIDTRVMSIPVLTLDFFPGRDIIKVCGFARGGTVRAKHVGRDIAASLKNLVGGEIIGYTELMAEGREEALYRMKCDAVKLGADAVIGFRFSTAAIDLGAAEILAYGTAVKLSETSDV